MKAFNARKTPKEHRMFFKGSKIGLTVKNEVGFFHGSFKKWNCGLWMFRGASFRFDELEKNFYEVLKFPYLKNIWEKMNELFKEEITILNITPADFKRKRIQSTMNRLIEFKLKKENTTNVEM